MQLTPLLAITTLLAMALLLEDWSPGLICGFDLDCFGSSVRALLMILEGTRTRREAVATAACAILKTISSPDDHAKLGLHRR
jgi:hypothetical protein